MECFYFNNLTNVSFTSSNGPNGGLLDGSGGKWWGIPGIGYLLRTENRPRLLAVDNSKSILIENLYFKDSPYWTVFVSGVDGTYIIPTGRT
jgi:polygalacturonase